MGTEQGEEEKPQETSPGDSGRTLADRGREAWKELPAERKIEIWAKQEDIAMHFNDLTMRLRLQALAGVGASTLIASSIFTHQGQVQLRYLGVFLIALGAIWAAIWAIDALYYQSLLKGSVNRILEIEKWAPEFGVSKAIEAEVNRRDKWRLSRRAFYGVPLVLLLVGGGTLASLGATVGPKSDANCCVKLCAPAP